MSKKIEVAVIIPSLRAGGAERVMSYIAIHLNRERFSTTLVVIGKKSEATYETNGIKTIFLEKDKVREAIWAIFKLLLKGGYDVVFSSLGHVNGLMAIFALFFWRIKFVGRETYVRSKRFSKVPKKKNILPDLQKLNLSKMVCQSKDMYNDLRDNYGFPEAKLALINNPITKDFQNQGLIQDNKGADVVKFITVGRLSKAKGHERILRALANLEYDFHYKIIGSGIEEASIKSLVNELRLDSKVEHIPFTNKVSEHLAHSDVYLMGSFIEGFPNALLESCAAGVPIVAYDAPGGINEIVLPGINGFIAKDNKEFFEYLKMAIAKDWDAKQVRNTVTERYSSEKIIGEYESLFEELVHNG